MIGRDPTGRLSRAYGPAWPVAQAAFDARRVFGSLDGLRGISILAVIWHHATSAHYGSNGLAGRGYFGVDLFFAISGFLITILLLRERDSTGMICLRHFYMRRTLRIFPLYFTVIGVYCLAVNTLDRDTEAGRQFWGNLPYFLTYTSNWFVRLGDERVIFYFAWSLATEEQFYLVWPSLERWLRGIRPVVVMLVLITIVQTARLGGLSEVLPQEGLAGTILGSIALPICLGVLLAHLLHSRTGFRLAWGLLGLRWSSLAAAFGLLITLSLDFSSPWWLLLVHVWMVLLVGACVAREDHALAGLLSRGPLPAIGVLSYGMYLLHMLALNASRVLLHHLDITSMYAEFALGTSLAFAAAWLSFRYYESVFLRMKHRFRVVRSAPRVAAAVPPAATAVG